MVLASTNKGKIAELRQILEPAGIQLRSGIDYPELAWIEETGSTMKENALIKAREAYCVTGLPSLADDSGLEVDALDGQPGVYSARYAGPDASDEDNIDKLLRELADYPEAANRTARFRTVLAYVDKQGSRFFEGVCEGHITTSPGGASGFGYDPVFIPLGCHETFAQMSSEDKNKISHRGKAVRAFQKFIEETHS